MSPPGATSAPPRPRPPIDPRLRARRIAVKRDEGRRRLRRFVVAAIVAALVAAAAAATRSSFLDVDRIEVTGAVRTEAPAIVEASGVVVGDPMTDVEVGPAEAAIEALPWVAQASVRRHWPARVVIEVEERTPVAVAPAAGGGWALLDGGGRVLEQVAEPPGDLPTLEGAAPVGSPGTAVEESGVAALDVAAVLPASLREQVAALAVGERRVRMRLRSEATVELGTTEQLEEKLLAVLTVLRDVDPATIRVLDVRVPTSPVLVAR